MGDPADTFRHMKEGKNMFDLDAVQGALRQFGLDGWLFYDFRGTNAMAHRILDFKEGSMSTRRFFYLVPATGTPQKLVHRIEGTALDHLPGEKHIYLRWQELESGLRGILNGLDKIAMEYSAKNAIPYVSIVDAGTVELVRGFGVNVVSSGDLIQMFEATLDGDQWQSHLRAEKHVLHAIELGFKTIAERVRAGKPPRETEVQAVIMGHFEDNGLVTDHPAIVAAGPHSGDPHYEPGGAGDATIKEGDYVMIDAWCRENKPRTVYADYTRVGVVGGTVPEEFANVFAVVREARDAGVAKVRDALAADKPVHGWEVDDATREVIDKAGYGEYFVHRTGHNIAQDLHGNGTHMDNLETHDDRRILSHTLFSVEPGIYMPEFGIRSEVNVYVDDQNHVHVTGDPQLEALAILR
jgi:Xaa-Pro aminopeptidase